MTNKLKYFIGNWKMFGDFGDFKIIHRINQFSYKSKNLLKKNFNQNLFRWGSKIVITIKTMDLLQGLSMQQC